MEVICINDEFSQEAILKIKKRPVKDKIYSIRDIIRAANGAVGVLLNEIHNEPLNRGSFMFEPRFNINRFTNLNGDKLSTEEVFKFLREKQNVSQK